jgi:hypothetical protein
MLETVVAWIALIVSFLIGVFGLVTMPRWWRREVDLTSPPPHWPFSVSAYSWHQRTRLTANLLFVGIGVAGAYIMVRSEHVRHRPSIDMLVALAVVLFLGALEYSVGAFNRPSFLVPPALRTPDPDRSPSSRTDEG